MLFLNRLSAATMALTVALSACTDGTGLIDEPFDPDASAADLQVMQGAFAASVFESLAISSEDFILVPDPPPPQVLLQASLAAASAGSRWESAAAAEAFAAVGPAAGPLVPEEYLGRAYDRDVDGYQHNPERTDVPLDRVRFILYGVDPVTREHLEPLVEIGYVDLIDEGRELELEHVIRVVVVTDEVVRINYTVSAEVDTQALGFAVLGFIGDGTDVIDVDHLRMTFVNDGPFSVATVDHLISVPTRDFEVDATVAFTFNNETFQGSIDVEGTFMQGAHTVAVAGVIEFGEGDFPSEGGTFEIHVDGQLFATITIDGETRSVRNADGGELTSVDAEAVRDIFDGLEDLFDDRFEDFIRPVARLFDR